MNLNGRKSNSNGCLGKALLTAALIASLVSSAQAPALSQKSTADELSTTSGTGRVLLKGGVNYCVPTGTPLKLKLATVPTMGMHMLNRDLEGNLHPAQLGQEITAKLSEDIYVDDNKVIPEGTQFYGRVEKIFPPRRVGRPGWLEIKFDKLETPEGKMFAFRAEADNFKKSTAKTKAKGFGIIAAHAAGGAVVGALVAYQLFGLEKTIACKGYNIAGGAAGGALLATGYALMRKGPKATLEPGDDLNLSIDTDLLMPAAVDPKPKRPFTNLEGLEISIDKCKTKKDNLEGHLKILDLTIDNNTRHRLESIDMFIEDSNGNRHPVAAGLDEDSHFLFTVEPHSMHSMKVTFRVEFPKLKYNLIWVDHNRRRVCYRQPLPI